MTTANALNKNESGLSTLKGPIDRPSKGPKTWEEIRPRAALSSALSHRACLEGARERSCSTRPDLGGRFPKASPTGREPRPFASHMSSLSRATKLPSSELSWRLLSNTRRCRSRCRSRTGRNRARAPGRRRFGSGIVCRCADGLRSRTMSCGLFAFAAPTTKRPFGGAARTARASSLPRRWRYDVGLGSLQDTS